MTERCHDAWSVTVPIGYRTPWGLYAAGWLLILAVVAVVAALATVSL